MNINTKYGLGDIVAANCYHKNRTVGSDSIIAQARVIGIQTSVRPICKSMHWYEKTANNQSVVIQYDLEPINDELYCNNPQFESSLEAITDDAPFI